MSTILDYVHRWAEECPDKPAIISRDGVISYRELYDRMRIQPPCPPRGSSLYSNEPSRENSQREDVSKKLPLGGGGAPYQSPSSVNPGSLISAYIPQELRASRRAL